MRDAFFGTTDVPSTISLILSQNNGTLQGWLGLKISGRVGFGLEKKKFSGSGGKFFFGFGLSSGEVNWKNLFNFCPKFEIFVRKKRNTLSKFLKTIKKVYNMVNTFLIVFF